MADTQHAPSTTEANLVKAEDNLKSDESDGTEPQAKRAKKNPDETRQMRLEQNRKAARESRQRKKVLVEELQRSVIFFSRCEFPMCLTECELANFPHIHLAIILMFVFQANGTLRSQNDEMEKMLLQARQGIATFAFSQPFSPQGAAPAPAKGAPASAGEGNQQPPQTQPPQGFDPNMFNWMNFQAAAMSNPAMMPFMGGMMPYGFPAFTPQQMQQGTNANQQAPASGVNNPLAAETIPPPAAAAAAAASNTNESQSSE